MRKQRRALKQKLKNEFLLEMNRNGHDNSIDTASSSDDDDEAEDEKEDAQHLSNVTIEEAKVAKMSKTERKRTTRTRYHTNFETRKIVKKRLNHHRNIFKSCLVLCGRLSRV